MNKIRVLLTGGLGYIGSHVALALSKSKYDIVILDNLSNSRIEVVERLEKIIRKPITFYKGDIRDKSLLELIIRETKVEAVIHMAGLKAVNESVQDPLNYYDNNVSGTLTLLQILKKYNIKKFIFSSSATVYGIPQYLPLDERHPTNPENPYGRSKLQTEQILKDLVKTNADWQVISLRYFNPAGADKSGLIGEEPNGLPNNLMPLIAQVASGLLPELKIYGTDYSTKDGTGIRDYIHITDLAEGHVAALEYIIKESSNYMEINLGSGVGYSVLQMVNMYEEISTKKIKRKKYPRRIGDLDICFADASLAYKILNWKTKLTLREMCEDSWQWQMLLTNDKKSNKFYL